MTKKGVMTTAVLLLGLVLGPSPIALAQQASPTDPMAQAERLLKAHGDRLFAPDAEDTPDPATLESIRKDIEAMHYGDDPRGHDAARSVFGANPVTSSANPLLDNSARERWLAQAIDRVGYDEVARHLEQQASMLQQGKISRSEWYEHVANCTMICNPVLQGLLYEHVRQVAAKPHLLVTFPVNSANTSADQRERLRDFTARMPEGWRYLLIGRASRTGRLEYNRHLSALRVSDVQATLERLGVSAGRIKLFWLGYEPPQLTDPIAKVYGLDPSLDDRARNQSVVVVAFAEPRKDG